MSVILRAATIADIPLLLKLEQSAAGTRVYSPMLEESEWKEELEKNVVLLIEKDGVVAGNISYEKKGNDHVYISGLVIDPRFQRKGIAREVMCMILKEMKDVGRLDLVTHPENTIALHLYCSLGFVIESRVENFYGDGEPRLVLVFQEQ